MYNREGGIEKAEGSTFAWMVDDGSQSTILQSGLPASPRQYYDRRFKWQRYYETERTKREVLRERTRDEFLTWLNSGRQVFHIVV